MANYLYNGVELPALPEYDSEHYEAAIFDLTGAGTVYFLDLQEKGYGYKVVDDCWELSVNENGETYAPVLYIKRATDTEWFMWPFGDGNAVYDNIYWEPLEDLPMVWTNSAVPVMNMDTGEVLMTASEPVPVGGEPDAPTDPDTPTEPDTPAGDVSTGEKYLLRRMFHPLFARALGSE